MLYGLLHVLVHFSPDVSPDFVPDFARARRFHFVHSRHLHSAHSRRIHSPRWRTIHFPRARLMRSGHDSRQCLVGDPIPLQPHRILAFFFPAPFSHSGKFVPAPTHFHPCPAPDRHFQPKACAGRGRVLSLRPRRPPRLILPGNGSDSHHRLARLGRNPGRAIHASHIGHTRFRFTRLAPQQFSFLIFPPHHQPLALLSTLNSRPSTVAKACVPSRNFVAWPAEPPCPADAPSPSPHG